MALTLNHFSIRATDLEACRRFYCDLLGLELGPRPSFDFPGLWLYAGDTAVLANAVVHIVGIDPNDPENLERDPGSVPGSGALDHVAFAATGLAAMRERLRLTGVACRERTVPGFGLHQVFVDDPNGVVIELNYPAAEAAVL